MGFERLPLGTGEQPFVDLIGQPGIGDRGLVLERLQAGRPLAFPAAAMRSSSSLSTKVSTRLTKKEATDAIVSGKALFARWVRPAR